METWTWSIVCVVSLLLDLVAVYCLFKTKIKGYKFILWVTICAFLNNITRLFSFYQHIDNHHMCTVQAVMLNTFAVATYFWMSSCSVVICAMLFKITIDPNNSWIHLRCSNIVKDFQNGTMWKFVMFNTTIPLILSLLPLSTGNYQHTGYWCWISSSGYDFKFYLFWGLLVMYIHIFVFVFISIIALIFIAYLKRKNKLQNVNLKDHMIRMTFYLLCSILISTFGIIRRSYEWHHNVNAPGYMQIAHAFGKSSTGIWILLFYSPIYKYLKCNIKCCAHKEVNDTQMQVKDSMESVHLTSLNTSNLDVTVTAANESIGKEVSKQRLLTILTPKNETLIQLQEESSMYGCEHLSDSDKQWSACNASLGAIV
eukprot:335487_1